tara:strand:- start:1123 stop:1494 length:372 start_codon:yes stop_codon:yes gene_type:complete
MDNPTFDQVSRFLRDFTGCSKKKQIFPETMLEEDLHITGDDGVELLDKAEKQFSVSFPFGSEFRELFELSENEYLFTSEGFDPIGIGLLIGWIRKKPKPIVKDLSVGKFHQVLTKLKQTQSVV